jgi:hypothetical protein
LVLRHHHHPTAPALGIGVERAADDHPLRLLTAAILGALAPDQRMALRPNGNGEVGHRRADRFDRKMKDLRWSDE